MLYSEFLVSLINLICSFSNGSESLNVESTPQTSLPYVRIGVTKESNNVSRSLHGLLRPMVFLILK